MINRDVLDEALQGQLAADILLVGGVPIQVGLSDVPSPTPTVPYLIMNWSPSPPPEGSLKDNEDMPYFDYMIKSVGKDHKETARTSSRVKGSMKGMRKTLSVSGAVIISTRLISLGIISPAMGPTLFEVNDIYRICLTDG